MLPGSTQPSSQQPRGGQVTCVPHFSSLTLTPAGTARKQIRFVHETRDSMNPSPPLRGLVRRLCCCVFPGADEQKHELLS